MDNILISAINTIRQSFSHGSYASANDTNLDEKINRYLHSAPAINDYVVGLDLYDFEGEKLVVVSYDEAANISVGETMMWQMYDETSRIAGVAYRVLSTYMVGKLQLDLPKALLSYHR
ncbi:hypothetical protein [Weissella cibaria]|uniref:hypothetical protein n=1 Tax=Weissella cibaria TaxID=137591 RepID=UPI0022E217C1|nr:hypothetical protein [Weissella cibaria]